MVKVFTTLRPLRILACIRGSPDNDDYFILLYIVTTNQGNTHCVLRNTMGARHKESPRAREGCARVRGGGGRRVIRIRIEIT